MRRRHCKAAVMRDAHLDLGAAAVAEQPHPRRAFRAGQNLNPAPRETDAGAVEALDHGFFGRPPARQALVVARAVGLLRRCVDLVEEAAARALYGKRDSINRDRVDADALHGFIVGLSADREPPPGPLRGPTSDKGGRPPFFRRAWPSQLSADPPGKAGR